MGYVDFYTFLIPLYRLSLGFDASEIGILVGARSLVAMFLAIHIGVLMDRFGTRKVTLFFVWTGMALARPRCRSLPAPSGISAAPGRPTSLAPGGAGC
jgi:MFS family permease